MTDAIDLLNRKREELERSARKAVLNLFGHTSSAAFILDLDPPHRNLFVIAGDVETLKRMAQKAEEAALSDPAPSEQIDEGDDG